MHILIIEDEKKTVDYLKIGFRENDFIVDAARTGTDGLHLALTGDYDVIILDVMLPGIDGWSVLTELRKKGNETPVLFLTARDKIDDRIKGLELGADDYLVKPFSFSELLLRIHTIERHSRSRQVDVIRIADMEIDLFRHKASRGGKRLDLTAKEFALLSLFARRKGVVLSRMLIAEQVWDMNFDSNTNVVDVAVCRLREKMDDPWPKKLIHTVRGAGYVMEER